MRVRLLVVTLTMGALTAVGGAWVASAQQSQPGQGTGFRRANAQGQDERDGAGTKLDVFVSGVCRNKEDKKPVANAVVQFHIHRDNPRRMDVWKTTRTDLDGLFTLDGKFPSELTNRPEMSKITVRAPGRASSWFFWQPDANYREPVEWSLAAAAKLEGRVVDATGRPVAGAHVSVSSPRVDGINDAVSSKDGRFVIDDMEPWDGKDHPVLSGLGLYARHRSFPKWAEGKFDRVPAAGIEIRFQEK